MFIAIADFQIRLNGSGNDISGRVEIFNPNFGWGTVCGDYYWDISDSNVVCRYLGFPGANAVRNGAYYGEGSGPILLSKVRCNGNESYIWDCPHGGWNKYDCSHSSDAGVECLCKKGYTFDGASCVGMYILMYYHFKNISTSITA
jgi:deleted-in-malignant-brain-tumors protein 1